MMKKSISSLPVLLGLAVFSLPSLWARSEEFHWSGHLQAGQSIEIKGVNGNVEAEAGGSQVEVHALKEGRRSDPSEVRIEVVEHSGGVTICAVYPNPDWFRDNECVPGKGGRNSVRDNDVRVDFQIRVPAGVDFVGRTVNGDVEAADLASNASGHTVNGKVDISCDGFGDAQTVNGSIRVSLGSAFSQDLEFSTVNGSVTLELPEEVDAEVRASSVNGSIKSDFPLSIKGRWGPQSARGTLGSGGPDLSIKTVNGSIKILNGRR